MRMSASRSLRTTAPRERDRARAGPRPLAMLRAGEQASVGDRRGKAPRAAIDARELRAGGLMDRRDRVLIGDPMQMIVLGADTHKVSHTVGAVGAADLPRFGGVRLLLS